MYSDLNREVQQKLSWEAGSQAKAGPKLVTIVRRLPPLLLADGEEPHRFHQH